MKRNYHTHTTRCGHATGSDEEYVLAALASGFDMLGFGDHGPWPSESGLVSAGSLKEDMLPEYIRSVQALRDKYAGQISIRTGFEIEYYPHGRDHLLRMRDQGVSYYILGQHFISVDGQYTYSGLACTQDDNVLRYADLAAEGIRTGLYSYIAHPDLFMAPRHDDFSNACLRATDMICQAAKEQNIPLEFNLHGRYDTLRGFERGYPNPAFWEHAQKWGCTAILGVDAHDPAELQEEQLWQDSIQYLKGLGYTLVKDIKHFE